MSSLAVAVTVVVTLVLVALVASLYVMVRAARRLRAASIELERESRALLTQIGDTVERAGVDLERVDDLIGSAEAISTTVTSASRLVYGAVAAPLIKAVAFGSGAAQASRRLFSSGSTRDARRSGAIGQSRRRSRRLRALKGGK